MNNSILTADEVCGYLKIPRSTLYKLSRDKRIPAFKIGRHWRFNRKKIDEWVKEQEGLENSRPEKT